jgi:hypothetical protein
VRTVLDVVGKMASMIFTIATRTFHGDLLESTGEQTRSKSWPMCSRAPLSRKRGFSKTPLSAHCPEYGLEYIHCALGLPAEYRDAYKAARTGTSTPKLSGLPEQRSSSCRDALDELQQLALKALCPAVLRGESAPVATAATSQMKSVRASRHQHRTSAPGRAASTER